MPRVAIAQMCSGIDPHANAEALVRLIADAAAGGAALLLTPEMCSLLDGNRDRARANLRYESEDETLARVREAAAEHRIWVHIGSMAVCSEMADGRAANRAFVIDDMGQIVARYDKMHLFDVDLPTGETWRESSAYTPGDAPVVVDTPVGRIGLSICYDQRFPALYQALSAAGAQILSVPAAFTVPTGRAHWHVLLRARAIENACYLVAAAQCGQHEDGRATFGHSLVIDPWGGVTLDMGENVGLGFVDIDLAQIDTVRGRVPVIAHRRIIPEAIRA